MVPNSKLSRKRERKAYARREELSDNLQRETIDVGPYATDVKFSSLCLNKYALYPSITSIPTFSFSGSENRYASSSVVSSPELMKKMEAFKMDSIKYNSDWSNYSKIEKKVLDLALDIAIVEEMTPEIVFFKLEDKTLELAIKGIDYGSITDRKICNYVYGYRSLA